MNICEYGCGREAKFQFKNGKWCCSKNHASCEAIQKKQAVSHVGMKISGLVKIEQDDKICFYCGNQAKFVTKDGKYCCQSNVHKCPANIEHQKELAKTKIVIQKLSPISNNLKVLCSYGCGNPAKFQTKNGKYCCEKYVSQCPFMRNLNKEGNKGRKHSEKTLKKMRAIQVKNRITLEQVKERYPLFYRIEELRYNSDKPGEIEIQVHCTYNNCVNSKTNGGWFTPTRSQLCSRIYALERLTSGIAEHNLYCSDECKKECVLYHLRKDPMRNTLGVSQAEFQIWREEVLRRQKEDIGYNECEYCENRNINELAVHHEKPQKTHPLLALDPDNGIVVCGANSKNKCHYKYGHKTGTECSTGALANKICL